MQVHDEEVQVASIEQINQFENVLFDVWHNLQKLPKLITYLVSKTWVLMSFKIFSEVFSSIVVCVVN